MKNRYIIGELYLPILFVFMMKNGCGEKLWKK